MVKLKIDTTRKAEPWAPVIATLTTLERAITTGESNAMEARWQFGRELLSHRKEYKGRQVIPTDLMTMAMEKCGRNKVEINWRVRFAVRFATKKEMLHAVQHYPSWRQMITVGLVDKTKTTKPKAASAKSHAGPWVIRRLTQEVDRAFPQHAQLTREQVKDLEDLEKKIRALLAQVDHNDARRLETKTAVG